VRAVEKLNAAGVPCGVLVAPVLPDLSDDPEQLEAVVRACVDAGARSISTVVLHLRPGVKDVFLDRLAGTHPHLTTAYRRRYRDRVYVSRADQQAVDALVREMVARHGGTAADRTDPEHMTGRSAPGGGPGGPAAADADGDAGAGGGAGASGASAASDGPETEVAVGRGRRRRAARPAIPAEPEPTMDQLSLL
jgi:hypothetical protein